MTEFLNLYKDTQLNLDLGINEVRNFPRYENLGIDNFEYYTADKFNKLQNLENDLKIINLNVRGLDRNYDNMINFLATIETKFHIIIVTECHIQAANLYNFDMHNKFSLTGYNLFYIKSKAKYGGVVVYVHNSLNASYLPELTVTNEICDALYLNISCEKLNLVVGGYYRHCSSKSADKKLFIELLEAQLSNKLVRNKPKLIAGDLNIDLMKCMQNADSLLLFNTLVQNNLENHIFMPTRIEHYKNSLQVRSATLIDTICSNLLNYKCKSGNMYYTGSDHFPNFLIVENFLQARTNKPNQTSKRRFFNRINTDQLNNDLENIKWDDLVLHENNINSCFENIINQCQTLLDKHAPLTNISNRKAKHINFKPWVDSELLQELKIKSSLYEKKKKLNSDSNNENYRHQKNKVTSLTRKKKTK